MAQHQDSAWKEILDQYLPQFLELCLPRLYSRIDWSKQWESLDQELNPLTQDEVIGKYIVDKLFKVFLLDGREQWILIHIEVQGREVSGFEKRMFHCAARLVTRHDVPIFSCAILTDDDPDWRPCCYESDMEGSKLRLDFVTVKLLDFKSKREMLETSRNPFATVILVQLDALGLKRASGESQLRTKVHLTRKLHEKGFSDKEIYNLMTFLDWLITLPEELEETYDVEVKQIEEKQPMAYVTTFERLGMKRGLEQGMQQGMEKGLAQGRQEGRHEGLQEGEAALLLRVMTRKFGAVSEEHRKLIAQSNCEQLLELAECVLEARSLEEIFEEIT